MKQSIRKIIAETVELPDGVDRISDSGDLYDAGMTSFDSVQLMLALEDAFGIEFPARMLNRKLFSTIANIDAAVRELRCETVQA